MLGQDMYKVIRDLFPLCRSITGKGVRETLDYLSGIFPLVQHEVPSGTEVFDWTIPEEWNIQEGYIADCNGKTIVDFKENNLHVMGYSQPVDAILDLAELLPHIYTEPSRPHAIPYVTSYYKPRWGFCMPEEQKKSLQKGKYHVCIKSQLTKGSLTYGEAVIPGSTDREIFISTYICHPSMANNELSGPAVAIYLAREISKWQKRKYTYRFIFVPETIGALTYLSRNLEHLKSTVSAGFNLSCVGDDRAYSYIASRYGDTLADKTLKNVLQFHYPAYKAYSFLERGSDERQYCAPGVDLPLCGFCRSKYGQYPEYHTSDDNLALVSEEGLKGAYKVMDQVFRAIENNEFYRVATLGEPQLGKRGIYPTVSQKGSSTSVRGLMNFLAYADGTNDLIDISNLIRVPVSELIEMANMLLEQGLISRV